MLALPALISAGPKDDLNEDLSKLIDVIDEKTADHGFTIWAVSKADFPLTVILELPELENFKSSVKVPATIVVQPRKKQLITRLSRINARKVSQYRTRWSYFWGWRDEKRDPAAFAYQLPYKSGYAYRIGQGFNGSFSHQGKNALDFAMPEGSTICAARGGTVIEVIQHNTEGGISEDMKTKGNRVLILHDDGSIARYVHLKHNGGLVKVGQKVKDGDEIGLSGATGYAQGPHLHFEIDRPPADMKGVSYESVPMQFVALTGDGKETRVDPKEQAIFLRPFSAGRWSPTRLPLNAVDGVTLCRKVSDGKPVDVTDTFTTDDELSIVMNVNLPARSKLSVSLTGPGDPNAPAVYRHEIDIDEKSSVYVMTLALSNLRDQSLAGRCAVHISCNGQELAQKPFYVKG